MKGAINVRLFNFYCYALLSVDHCDEPDNEPDSPNLLGFWPDAASANATAKEMEERRVAGHIEWWKKHPMNLYHSEATQISVTRYAVIPLSQVEADDLSDLETKLEQAARLHIAGVGKTD
jgi:hypothetical protein